MAGLLLWYILLSNNRDIIADLRGGAYYQITVPYYEWFLYFESLLFFLKNDMRISIIIYLLYIKR